MTDDRDWAALANRVGPASATDGKPAGWLHQVWDAAERDEVDLPWDRTDADPAVAEHAASLGPGDGRRAVVVGAALGADAEALAAAGWATTAFDISPAAVRLAQERYPDSLVDYRVDDLLALSDELTGAFDLVAEVYTVQALPPSVRDQAVAGIRALLAPGGEAVLVQYVRGDADPDEGPPWLLDRAQMESFAAEDVELVSLTDDGENWRGLLRRRP